MIADEKGYHYPPPGSSRPALGIIDPASAYAAYQSGRTIWDTVSGLFSGESGEEKARETLTAGAACPGPYDERQVLGAIQALGTSHPAVQELRRRVLIKDWLQNIGLESNDAAMARAAVHLAHGGSDCKHGNTEQLVADAVGAVMSQAGQLPYSLPAPTTTRTATTSPYDTPVVLGLEYESEPKPTWPLWLGAAFLAMKVL
jgi:hypothetical protein